MTMTQKILAAHAGLPEVKAGQLIEAKLDLCLGNDITSPVAINEFERCGASVSYTHLEINNSQYDGKFGKMYWPVPAVKNIASPFGTRYLGGHSFHKGIDISEGFVPVYGKPIYAAADGVVISAINYANTSGFGYYVVIDHGYDENGVKITTLYAHLSLIHIYRRYR